ncbi:hypothetical protein KGM_200194 [Danaus plexippus plexippus]|uniref:Uncharacterized protein n=1 Tax=Danaus plexippus plexippus TaxID=278856 RepID=A0A212F990_DANPL|nr:hypothetical protein KGM_200194 [Danaus plexippus plexippus]
MRECNVEINGIPENRNENLLNIMQQLSIVVENPISSADIHVATVVKLNKDSNRPRVVILKICNSSVRDNLLASVNKFNKIHNGDKLSSMHLGIGNKRKPIFEKGNSPDDSHPVP